VAKADIRLDNPKEYLRILEGCSFKGASIKLTAKDGILHVKAQAADRTTADCAVSALRKQAEIVSRIIGLLQ
jgi:hypothetical protein